MGRRSMNIKITRDLVICNMATTKYNVLVKGFRFSQRTRNTTYLFEKLFLDTNMLGGGFQIKYRVVAS